MEKSLDEMETKDFLNDALDIKNIEVKKEITKKLQEIKVISEKMNHLKNIVDDRNLSILLINQNLGRLQIKIDALKNEVTIAATEPEKIEE